MADPALLAEAYKRGLLPPDKKAAYEEAMRRGLLSGGAAKTITAPSAPPKSRGYTIARENLEKQNALTGGGSGDFTTQMIRNLGVNDELEGGIGFLVQGGKNLFRRATGQPIVTSAADAAQAAMDLDRERGAAYAREKPVRNALATGAGILAAGAPARGAALAMSPLRAGATAATANAPFALARQEGTLAERAPGAALETAMSFGVGSALQAGGNALARRAAAARVAPPTPARRLSNEGVTLTPGQMVGGIGKRVEDVLTSAPITGAAINARRAEGLDDLNRAGYNRVLKPLGKSVGPNDPAGREGVAAVQREISDAYSKALTGVTVAPDAQFAAEIAAIKKTPNLTTSQKETLDSILGDINTRFTGAIDGDLWKNIHADLNTDLRGVGGSDRVLKAAVKKARDALVGSLQRANPQAATGVAAADEAMANFVRIREGAARIGAEDGVMTAPQMLSAVRSADGSAGKGAFAGGNALMQDLAETAKSVLPNKVHDSGTALRGLVGVGTYGGGAMANPGVAAGALATDAAGGILYSRPVVNLMNRIYRASTPGQARAALAELAQLAARNPALAPAYREAAQALGVQLPATSRPQNALSAPQGAMSR